MNMHDVAWALSVIVLVWLIVFATIFMFRAVIAIVGLIVKLAWNGFRENKKLKDIRYDVKKGLHKPIE